MNYPLYYHTHLFLCHLNTLHVEAQ